MGVVRNLVDKAKGKKIPVMDCDQNWTPPGK
jgi:hypothetical protein